MTPEETGLQPVTSSLRNQTLFVNKLKRQRFPESYRPAVADPCEARDFWQSAQARGRRMMAASRGKSEPSIQSMLT